MHFLLYSLLNYKISVSVLFFVFVCMFVCCFLFLFFFQEESFLCLTVPSMKLLRQNIFAAKKSTCKPKYLSWWKTEVIPLVHFWFVSAESEMFLPSMDLISTDVKARYKQGTTFFLVLKYTSVFLNFH